MAKGVSAQLRILSDGADQFNLLVHALCWVHAERALRRWPGYTARQRQNIEEMQQLLWDYYRQLPAYPENPTAQTKLLLEACRKISGGTRSEAGRRARDTFVGLKKTCRKLGISFWHFLIPRLRGDGQIPPLPDVIRAKALAVT